MTGICWFGMNKKLTLLLGGAIAYNWVEFFNLNSYIDLEKYYLMKV